MDKDINCLNFKGLFGYLEKRFGADVLHQLVNKALGTGVYWVEKKNHPGRFEPVSMKHLTDESYWISNELSLQLLGMIKQFLPGPNPEQTAGQGSVLEFLSNRDLFFSKIIGPTVLAQKAAKVNRKFNRTKDVKVARLQNNCVAIDLRYKPGFKVTKDVCNWNLGIYIGLAKASGARSIQAEEVKCILNGDDYCRIKLTWRTPSLFKRLYQSVLRLFTQELIAEYEKTVNDRDRLIEKLSASEHQYRLLIENQSDMVVKIGVDGRFQFVSPSYCKLFGKAEKELVGEKALSYVHADDHKATIKAIKALYQSPYRGRIEHRAMTKDGYRWLSWRGVAIFDNDNNVIAITGVGRDITEQRRVEEALKQSEAFFKLITDNTSALVSIHDANTNYIFASPSHERLGYQPGELIGRSSFTMMDEADIGKLLAQLEKAQKGLLSKALMDYRLKDKQGNRHYFRGSFDAVFRWDGSLEKIVCVGEDISELRKAQSQREKALNLAAESKKLALIGQVAGKMAHDFNNILGVIMGLSELLLMQSKDAVINKKLEMIFEQTIRGKNLTQNLVAFAKSRELKQEFFKINEKIDLVLSLMKKDLENISLTINYASDMKDLLADPGMIEHALVNLIQNAVHALSQTQNPRLIIRTYCRDKHICFEIEDNGCGIPEEYLDSIYEPSFTLKGGKDRTGAYATGIKGTGYGMANVKKYIEQHHGEISVDSVVNEGAKFTVRLPMTEKRLSTQEQSEFQKTVIHSEKYILLVEDEPAIADFQYHLLTQNPCNHRVDVANNGRVAMDLFDRNHYDLISLDYMLPGSINGMDVYNHIRQTNPSVPILFVSGNLEFLESIEALKQKDRYVEHRSKPCKNIDYLNCINQLMASRSVNA